MSVGPVDIEFVLKGDVDAQLKRVSQTVAGESKALQDQVAAFGEKFGESFDKAGTSISGMQEKLAQLKKIYSELSEEGRSSEFGKVLTDQIGALEGSIKKAEGQNRSFMDSITQMPGPIGAAASGMLMMTKAALRFIATPIGAVITAIVLALKALTTWFKSSEEGENALAEATAIFKQVMESLLDPVEKVGEWLWKAFTKPKEALNDLVEFMKNQVINRIEAIGDAGRAVIRIFTGEFKAGFTDLKNASVQFGTGIEDAGPKISGYFTDAVAKTKQRVELTKQANLLEAKTRDFVLERSKMEAKISELRFKATDQDLPASERLSSMKQAASEVNALYSKEISLAQEKLDVAKGLASLDDQTKQDKQDLINLEADVIRLQGQRADELRGLSRQTNTLAKMSAEKDITGIEKMKAELEQLNKSILDAGADEQKQIAERILQLQKEIGLRMQIAEQAILAARNTIPPEAIKPISMDPNKTFATQIKAGELELDKLKKKIEENTKKAAELSEKGFDPARLKQFSALTSDILSVVSQITQEYALQLGLNEDQAKVIDKGLQAMSGVADIASGNYLQGAAKIADSILATMLKVPEAINVHFENLQKNIEKTLNSIQIVGQTLANLGDSGITRAIAVIESQLKTVGKEAQNLNKELAGKAYGPRRDFNTAVYRELSNQIVNIENEISSLTDKLLRGQLSDAQRKAIEAVLNSYNDLLSQLDNITQEIIGTTVQSLAESIAEAFITGEDAAESWGQKVNDVIKYITTKQLTAELLLPSIKQATDQLVKDTEGGLSKDEARKFKEAIESITTNVGPAFEAAREALSSVGIDLGASTTDTKGLTGAITGITEETGGMISGHLYGIRFDIKEVIRRMAMASDDMTLSLAYQAEIAANTRHNARLVNINEQLEKMNKTLETKL